MAAAARPGAASSAAERRAAATLPGARPAGGLAISMADLAGVRLRRASAAPPATPTPTPTVDVTPEGLRARRRLKRVESCGKREERCGKREERCGKREESCGKREESCGKREEAGGRTCGKAGGGGGASKENRAEEIAPKRPTHARPSANATANAPADTPAVQSPRATTVRGDGPLSRRGGMRRATPLRQGLRVRIETEALAAPPHEPHALGDDASTVAGEDDGGELGILCKDSSGHGRSWGTWVSSMVSIRRGDFN